MKNKNLRSNPVGDRVNYNDSVYKIKYALKYDYKINTDGLKDISCIVKYAELRYDENILVDECEVWVLSKFINGSFDGMKRKHFKGDIRGNNIMSSSLIHPSNITEVVAFDKVNIINKPMRKFESFKRDTECSDNIMPSDLQHTPRTNKKKSYARKYDEFLDSEYWGIVKDIILIRDGFRCRECKRKDVLHVHHLTYEHHGMEHKHLDDLISLCNECHKRKHGLT